MGGTTDRGMASDGATCWRGICTSLPSALLPADMTWKGKRSVTGCEVQGHHR